MNAYRVVYPDLLCKKRFLFWEGSVLIAVRLTTSLLDNLAAIFTLSTSAGTTGQQMIQQTYNVLKA